MDLSLIQKKILKLLCINSRFSNKDIAKTLNVSADTVNYQINNLLNKKKIGKWYVQFDYRMVGFYHYHYLLRVKDRAKLDLKELNALKFITFINTSQGKYDLQLIIAARNELEFEKHVNTIDEIIGENLQEFSILKFVSQYKYTYLSPNLYVPVPIPKNKKNPVYSLNKIDFSIGDSFDTIKLDDTDKKIIQELIKDPRASYLEISRVTGISHETIRYRVAQYVKKRFISNFGISHDWGKHGFFTNYLFLKLKSHDTERFRTWVKNNKHVFYSARLLGEYNCILYILAKTPHEFNQQVKEMREIFKDSLLDLELLYFEDIVKNVQFPELLL